jgi:hypothetical protein
MPIKRSLPALLITVLLASAAHAQRGGGHVATSAHLSPSFHSNAVAPAAPRPASQAYVPRASAINPRTQTSFRPSPAVSSVRPAFYRGNRNGHPVPTRRARILYTGYGYPAYIGANYLAYNGPYLDDATPTDVSSPDDQPAPDPGPYLDQPQPSQTEPDAQPDPPPAPEAITLIFKDGHTQQIYNFLATRSSISVIEGQRHYDIAVSDLNIPATQIANRAAGVDFALPGPTQ